MSLGHAERGAHPPQPVQPLPPEQPLFEFIVPPDKSENKTAVRPQLGDSIEGLEPEGNPDSLVHQWLECVRPGWGRLFLPAFEAVGVVDLVDLITQTAGERKALDYQLQVCGAEEKQLERLHEAIEELFGRAPPMEVKEGMRSLNLGIPGQRAEVKARSHFCAKGFIEAKRAQLHLQAQQQQLDQQQEDINDFEAMRAMQWDDDWRSLYTKARFIKLGLAIFFAYLISQFFWVVVGGLMFSSDNTKALTTEDNVIIQVIWLSILFAFSEPLKVLCRSYVNPHAAKRGFWQDCIEVFFMSLPILSGWAFKDLVEQVAKLFDKPHTTWADYGSWDNIESTLRYSFSMLGIACAWTVGAAVWQTAKRQTFYFQQSADCLSWFHVNKLFEAKTEDKKIAAISESFVWEGALFMMPPALGLGLAWKTYVQSLKYFVPQDLIEEPILDSIIVQALDLAFGMIFILRIMAWSFGSEERAKECKQEGIPLPPWPTNRVDLANMTAPWYLYFRDMIIAAFLRAQPYAFAWQLSDLINLMYYNVMFHPTCYEPYTKCGTFTIWMNFWLAVLFTGIGILTVPHLNKEEHQQIQMGDFYGKTLLKDDKRNLIDTFVRHKLVDSFFGISIGWAWAKVTATECEQEFFLHVPDEANTRGYYVLLHCHPRSLFSPLCGVPFLHGEESA